jgi:hypothetical protein
LTKDFQQVPAESPRPLETSEIAVIISAFRQAALNAIEAGFDGVELQGPNSHLIEQFLDEENETVTHTPSVALVPNLILSPQRRSITLGGELLTLRAMIPVTAGSSLTSRLEWHRAGTQVR